MDYESMGESSRLSRRTIYKVTSMSGVDAFKKVKINDILQQFKMIPCEHLKKLLKP